MLLAFTGLRNLGIITFDSATLITLGGCPANQRNYLYAFDHRLTTEDLATASMQSLPIPAPVYGCIGEDVSWVLGNLCALVCSVHDSTAVHSCAARWHVQASWLAAADVPHPPNPLPPSLSAGSTLQMRSPTMWLGIAGGFLMCILLYMGVKGSLIIGIA